MTFEEAAQSLIDATMAMHAAGAPLMQRILPQGEIALWDHYPEFDRVSPKSGARFFYHCHPVEERGVGEHGHFHLFLAKSAMPRGARSRITPPRPHARATPRVVHIAGLSISPAGLPTALFTVNQWVTGEWLFAAEDIARALPKFDLLDADGDPLVNQWLTALVHLAKGRIISLLEARDQVLDGAGWDGESRALEITSSAPFDIDQLLEKL